MSPLCRLPLDRWAARFSHGSVSLRGWLAEPITLGLACLSLPAGSVTVDLAFVGGDPPTVQSAVVSVPGPGGEITQTELIGLTAAPMVFVQRIVDGLHDPAIRVLAVPGADLVVQLAPGVHAQLPAHGLITVEAAAKGPPDAPRLHRSFVASVGGSGLSIRLPGSKWLRVLASISIRRALIAPDGAVELVGSEDGRFERAVGVGLRHASHHLSDLVRRSPQFARVRSFLSDT